jgi:hypothetical protein
VMRKALHHDDEYLHLEDEAERKAEPIAWRLPSH